MSELSIIHIKLWSFKPITNNYKESSFNLTRYFDKNQLSKYVSWKTEMGRTEKYKVIKWASLHWHLFTTASSQANPNLSKFNWSSRPGKIPEVPENRPVSVGSEKQIVWGCTHSSRWRASEIGGPTWQACLFGAVKSNAQVLWQTMAWWRACSIPQW